MSMREEYLAKRKELLDKADKFIKENKLSDAETVTAEIEKLDSDYEKQALANANLNALANKVKVPENVVNKGEKVSMSGEVTQTATDVFDTHEYRNAFMNYVVRKAAMPDKFKNLDENTTTPDVSVMIPTTVLNRIIEKMETIGVILPQVTRTSYKGGLVIPTSDVKPVATWVAEGSGSDRQKKTTGKITFAYHKLRCAISMSLEVGVMALSAFESKFVADVATAMTKALEKAIISGDGTSSPKGILTETPAEGQAIKIRAGEALSYSTLINMEAALPSAYENGSKWYMTKKTFMQFVGMIDGNGQPIARTNYGVNGRPERTLLGRSVDIIDEYLDSYSATVSKDTVIAFIFNMSDYILNTNLNITTKTYEDNDTDDTVVKSYMLVDGKVVDKNSLVTLTISNS